MEILNVLSFIGVFCLFAMCMIGNLMLSHDFLNCCIPKKLEMEVDKICWVPSKRNIFEVKFYYQALSTLTQAFSPWKSTWKVKIPLRVAFFVWTASLGKILTLDSLRKRNIMVMGWCYV
jgi:predicted P-loop ATPase/GTPase